MLPFKRPDKSTISSMPPYDALTIDEIEVVVSKARAIEVAEHLITQQVVGFDSESKPRFKKGEVDTGPHLLQFATIEQAFLFPINCDAFSIALQLVADERIKKIGFGLKDDGRQLVRNFDVTINNSLDVSTQLARFMEDENPIGARPAVAMLFGRSLSKRVQMSNWRRSPLTPQQVLYAGLDAQSALAVWLSIKSLIAASPKI